MRHIVLIIIVGLFIASCGGDKNSVTNPSSAANPATQTDGEVLERYNNVSKEEADRIIAEREQAAAAEKAQNLPSFRAHAKELIKAREKTEKAMSFLVVDHWQYEFVFNGKEMSKPGEYDGQWLKFEDDHTYTYGLYDEVRGSGEYHYSLDQGKMIMVDSKDDIMPEEWEVKAQDEVMILVGAGYFGNNPRQCKMLRWNGRPVAPAS